MLFKAAEAEFGKERRDPLARRLARQSLHFKAQRRVVDDAAPGHQRVMLRHEGKAALAAF
ncbi:hypothetical protein D3C85_1866940 [compost metagenome]